MFSSCSSSSRIFESSSRIGNCGCQEKYLVYSTVENNSWATKKAKVLCPSELFDIKTKAKTEVIFRMLFVSEYQEKHLNLF